MNTKEEIEAKKRSLKNEYGNLFNSIAEILFKHDPISINFEVNTDEYEPEARTILPRIKTCHSVDEVVNVVYEEFQRWFGHDSVGSKEEYQEIAEEIWSIWQKRKPQRYAS